MYDEALISSVKSANSVNRTLRELGLVRLFVGGTLPDEFTDEEKKLATALVCRKYNSKTASNEADSIIEDLNVIDSKPIPDVATLLIISDGTVTVIGAAYEIAGVGKAAAVIGTFTVGLSVNHLPLVICAVRVGLSSLSVSGMGSCQENEGARRG